MARRFSAVSALAALLLSLAVASCSAKKASEGVAAPGTTGAAPAAAPDNASPGVGAGAPLFVINGEPVDAAEFREFVGTVTPDEVGKGPAVLPALVDHFINNRLLAAKAVKEKVSETPAVRSRVAARLSDIWADVYWNELVKATVRIDDRDVMKKAPAAEDTLTLQQLVVDTREQAEALRARAVKGEDFGEIIRAHSRGLTTRNSGILPGVRKGSPMYDPDLLKTLFAMKKGQLTPTTETKVGFVVIRVLEHKTAGDLRKEWFAKNRESVRAQMEHDAWEDARSKLVRKQKIKVHQATIDAYLAARDSNAPLDDLLGKPVVTIDGMPLLLRDVTDPTGMGMIHGEKTLEPIVNKRAAAYVVAREVERRGLKAKYPAEALRERLLKENILARAYIDFRCKDLKVSADEMREYFKAKKGHFTVPRALDISVIETKSDKRLKEIYDELRKGTPFGEVADRYSDRRDAKEGRIGLVEAERITPEFAALRSLKVGEYSSAPIRLAGKEGATALYMVARLNAIREARPMTFEEADRPSLEKAVMAGKREDVIKKIFEELRKGNKVEFKPGYDAFRATFKNNPTRQGGAS